LDAEIAEHLAWLEAMRGKRLGTRAIRCCVSAVRGLAAFRIATQLLDERLIDADEALRRVSGAQPVQLMFPQFDTAPGSRAEGAGARSGHVGLAGRGGR